MTRTISLLALLCAALALAACDRARPVAAGGGGVGACAGCHGDAARDGDALVRAAPPVSALGGDGGAHLAHLTGATFRAPLACDECHDVPTLVDHADGTVQLPMAGLAAADGASPSWSDASATCSGVYCHGATLLGGPAASPAWTSTAALGCASCHGLPPPAPHPADAACDRCHLGYTSSTVSAATHLDGTVQRSGHDEGYDLPGAHGRDANTRGIASCQACHGPALDGGTSGVSCDGCHGPAGFPDWETTCTFCHGDVASGRASPPVDTLGGEATTNVSVGAHAAHVGTALTTPLACTTCHPDRAGSNVATDPAHVDGDGRAEVAFGARAGASPTYVRASDTSATCASTYCHGSHTMQWTDATPLGCGSCHGAPPAGHSTSPCGTCHVGYTASSVDPTTHLDGDVDATSPHPNGFAARDQHGYQVNLGGLASCKGCHGPELASCSGVCHGGTAWRTNCTFCHGNPSTLVASPPVDTRGRSLASNVSVGVHASHVVATFGPAAACTECHPDRAGSDVVTDGAHIDGDGRAEIAFGPRATAGGAPATYTHVTDTSATCASTYCHGRFPGGFNGGAGATPNWTSTAQVGCTSCHGNPPSTGRHSKHGGGSFTCTDCHPHGGFSPLHLDGSKSLALPSPASFNGTSCGTFSCHGKNHDGGDTW